MNGVNDILALVFGFLAVWVKVFRKRYAAYLESEGCSTDVFEKMRPTL